jgi:amidohydrolase
MLEAFRARLAFDGQGNITRWNYKDAYFQGDQPGGVEDHSHGRWDFRAAVMGYANGLAFTRRDLMAFAGIYRNMLRGAPEEPLLSWNIDGSGAAEDPVGLFHYDLSPFGGDIWRAGHQTAVTRGAAAYAHDAARLLLYHEAAPAPEAFGLLFAQTAGARRTLFRWEVSARACKYTLQISESEAFAPLLLDRADIPDTCAFVEGLPAGKTLYWRVIAENQGGGRVVSDAQRLYGRLASRPKSPAPSVREHRAVTFPWEKMIWRIPFMHEELKRLACAAIDAAREQIVAWGEQIASRPALGFKETHASALVREAFDNLGIPYEYPLALTGVKGRLNGSPGPINVCLVGEMDAVPCVGHPGMDPLTGAAHACGHNAQVAALLGAALGLAENGVMARLQGGVRFFAVPAEEYIDLDYRRHLAESGAIQCMSGKQQLIAQGAFDDVSMAMMVHALAETPTARLQLMCGSLGFVMKEIAFHGVQAHAARPDLGVHALNAAMLALMGIHANRETFRDEDGVRVHPIVTHGGDAVNCVPSRVTMEMAVRGRTAEAIADAAGKVDRAARGAAMAVGASAEIADKAGYLPLAQDERFSRVFEGNARALLPAEDIWNGGDLGGSTDMGDLSRRIPCIHPLLGGFSGALHSRDFRVADPEAAYVLPAKLMAMTVIDLLADGAKSGKQVVEGFTPSQTPSQPFAAGA